MTAMAPHRVVCLQLRTPDAPPVQFHRHYSVGRLEEIKQDQRHRGCIGPSVAECDRRQFDELVRLKPSSARQRNSAPVAISRAHATPADSRSWLLTLQYNRELFFCAELAALALLSASGLIRRVVKPSPAGEASVMTPVLSLSTGRALG